MAKMLFYIWIFLYKFHKILKHRNLQYWLNAISEKQKHFNKKMKVAKCDEKFE